VVEVQAEQVRVLPVQVRRGLGVDAAALEHQLYRAALPSEAALQLERSGVEHRPGRLAEVLPPIVP
jgi:hypothetical protein